MVLSRTETHLRLKTLHPRFAGGFAGPWSRTPRKGTRQGQQSAEFIPPRLHAVAANPSVTQCHEDMMQRKLDSAKPTGEPASAVRSLGQDPIGRHSLCWQPRAGSSGLRPGAETKRERRQMPGLGRRGGWRRKGWKRGRDKQGDPPGTERCSWPSGPKSRPAGVRASVVAKKRGNARGAKGRRKVEA